MKKQLLIGFTFGFILVIFNSCGGSGMKNDTNKQKTMDAEQAISTKIYGNYVDADYHKRNEGYDWIAVMISPKSEDKIGIKVRSRADKKKPTCTFDATAYKTNNNTYKTYAQEKAVVISFQGKQLLIQPENDSDLDALNFYCSGGGSFVGTYEKLDETLDRSQIDPTLFSKLLELQGIGFNITSMQKNGETELTVAPYGLEIVNRPETTKIYGTVSGAEIEDMNRDGSPEILIYVHSKGSGSYGNVIAYSVNNRKSMSSVYFPPVAENKKINKGYMGHDEFSLVENYLVQRFPIYMPEDANANPTGGIRQITYELKDGEASRRFEIKNVEEFK